MQVLRLTMHAPAAAAVKEEEASVAPAEARVLNDNAHGIDRFGYRARALPLCAVL